MFGKLHFGNNPKGVDDFLILPGQGSYINPKFIGKKKDTIIQGYVTDIITDVTLNWLDKKRDKTKPFMMMYLHKALGTINPIKKIISESRKQGE